MLENINTKIDGLTSSINNQMSSNKMIETQIAQLAATILFLVQERFRDNLKLLSNLLK